MPEAPKGRYSKRSDPANGPQGDGRLSSKPLGSNIGEDCCCASVTVNTKIIISPAVIRSGFQFSSVSPVDAVCLYRPYLQNPRYRSCLRWFANALKIAAWLQFDYPIFDPFLVS
jgi:hypothetical protein